MFMSPSGFLKKSKNLRGKGAAELDMDAWDMPSEDVWRGTGCYALHAKRQKNDEETDHSLWNQLDLQENLQEKWCIVNPCNNGPVSCGLSQQPGEMPVGPRWGQGWQTCRRWTRSEAASKLFVLRLPSWLRKPMVWGIGGLSNSQKHQLILACFFFNNRSVQAFLDFATCYRTQTNKKPHLQSREVGMRQNYQPPSSGWYKEWP